MDPNPLAATMQPGQRTFQIPSLQVCKEGLKYLLHWFIVVITQDNTDI